jgi:DNA modification methylase
MENNNWHDMPTAQILQGDVVEVLKSLPSNSIDSIVTDPPYGIGMGLSKSWDSTVPGKAWAEQCLRVLKPGGHMIAFSSNRTLHRLVTAVEDVGFEIRDTIHWFYQSSFPKNHNIPVAIDKIMGFEPTPIAKQQQGGAKFGMIEREIDNGGFNRADRDEYTITAPTSKEAQTWHGWGTALKSCIEPATLARKPIEEKTIAHQILATGTGGLNIEACRFKAGDPAWLGNNHDHSSSWDRPVHTNISNPAGSFMIGGTCVKQDISRYKPTGRWPANIYNCKKPTRAEKEAGCSHLPTKNGFDLNRRKPENVGHLSPHAGTGRVSRDIHNHHTTVKPIEICRWLCRLVTQPNGTVLDTFVGSGTTCVAALLEGFNSIGIERDPEYCKIAEARVEWAREEYKKINAQLSLF